MFFVCFLVLLGVFVCFCVFFCVCFCCLLSVVCCLLSVVCCLLSVVCFFLGGRGSLCLIVDPWFCLWVLVFVFLFLFSSFPRFLFSSSLFPCRLSLFAFSLFAVSLFVFRVSFFVFSFGFWVLGFGFWVCVNEYCLLCQRTGQHIACTSSTVAAQQRFGALLLWP